MRQELIIDAFCWQDEEQQSSVGLQLSTQPATRTYQQSIRMFMKDENKGLCDILFLIEKIIAMMYNIAAVELETVFGSDKKIFKVLQSSDKKHKPDEHFSSSSR